jgi:chromosome segregation ATPase
LQAAGEEAAALRKRLQDSEARGAALQERLCEAEAESVDLQGDLAHAQAVQEHLSGQMEVVEMKCSEHAHRVEHLLGNMMRLENEVRCRPRCLALAAL